MPTYSGHRSLRILPFPVPKKNKVTSSLNLHCFLKNSLKLLNKKMAPRLSGMMVYSRARTRQRYGGLSVRQKWASVGGKEEFKYKIENVIGGEKTSKILA